MDKTLKCAICGMTAATGLLCGCQSVQIQADQIQPPEIDSISRPLLAAVRSYFEDPAIKADYENWLVDYKKRKKPVPSAT